MDLVNVICCKCGACKLTLGDQIQNVSESHRNAARSLGIEEPKFFNLEHGCLSTLFESNIRVSKPSEHIYKLSCKSCNKPFYIYLSNNRTMAITKKGKYKASRRLSNSLDDDVYSSYKPNPDSIRDLIKIKGNVRSPVMLPQIHNTPDSIKPMEPLEPYNDFVFQDQEIVHDCMFGSYNFDYMATEQFIFA
ncbi:hypothetical protein TVAG_197740 [Trichomonas vaginalis G3]|uniref:Uncharacterized protein n=1 Tax=Trichomonas vaginalis (strain ATCC PRA-98 / G3) TaxID=412133 RepID=A2EJJ1_TRIV3|nr:hypothetical protein TVAGG3_0617690 [Trichomonas vaginalis G3]EAY07161.1 hypothetical protein TVAG_197740 [Trichomonas vaginalis G3]KAI5503668.1 hypothetical protein TVAGG3_0617690 [Trichomonas vaginalis G3]|eukprot:XP_001319384.1 hypothetical protein [Trichomonas vaginalis G3]